MAKVAKKTPVKKTARTSAKKEPATATKKKTVAVKKETSKPSVGKKTTATNTILPKKNTTIKNDSAKKTPVAPKKIAVRKTTSRTNKVSAVDIIAQAMLDKKAQRVVSLDLMEIGTAICDHFVLCHADSTTQVLAIANNVEKEMFEKAKEWPIRVQGKENAFWIILDYGDAVVHIFQTEYRLFYRLEELWADAVRKIHTVETKLVKNNERITPTKKS